MKIHSVVLFFLVSLLILIAGCGYEADAHDTATIYATAIESESTSPAALETSNIANTPTPRYFDIKDVRMQSTPESSCFSEVGYDSDWEILVVQFRESGAVYTYSNFPHSEWNRFISADSLGNWYNKYIKGYFECERIK